MLRRILFVIVAVGVLVAGGYSAGAWYVGKRVQASMDAGYRKIAASEPMLTVNRRQYERGLFTSQETLTLGLGIMPGQSLLKFRIVNTIHHLPLQGLLRRDSATMDSTVTLAEDSVPQAVEWLGRGLFITGHTRMGFEGEFGTTVTMPGRQTAHLSSEPATLTMAFSPDRAHYMLQGRLPRLTVMPGPGFKIEFTGITLDSEHSRIQAVPDLYSGTDRYNVAQIDVFGPLAKQHSILSQFSAVIDVRPQDSGANLDLQLAYALEYLVDGESAVGPARLELSMRHLHTRALASLFSNAGKVKPGQAGPVAQVMKDMKTILLNDPQLDVKLDFTVLSGDNSIAARAGFKDLQPSDLDQVNTGKAGTGNPFEMLWRDKGWLKVDMRVPESEVTGPARDTLFKLLHENLSPERLVEMIEAGYLERDGWGIKTRFEFRDGGFLLNNHPWTLPPPQSTM